MYEDPVVKGVDYLSLILGDNNVEFEDLESLNRYRTKMIVYFRKVVEEASKNSSIIRRKQLKDWFDFNKDFIGFMKNSELVEDLEGILFDFGNR